MKRYGSSVVIPIRDLRDDLHGDLLAARTGALVEPDGRLRDALDRPIHDLRISVTDRCNFRCTYCMPKEVFDRDHRYLPHGDLLSFEEITRLARVFVAHGVQKIRLTGGEPLLRKDLERLIAMLAEIELPHSEHARSDARAGARPDARLDLTLTTNGSLLRKKARSLKAAGLTRITVSLDALDDRLFRGMNDVDFPVADVLDGIAAAAEAGLGPIKVNMVVKRGFNDSEIEPMARHFRGTGHILRFIEYMDVGASNGWKLDEVLASSAAVKRIDALFPIEPVDSNYAGEVAERWRYKDGAGEIGFISSVTHAFCGSCSRARLSPEGRLYTCLFATRGADLRTLLRSGASDLELAGAVGSIWSTRTDRYSELRGLATTATAEKIEMSYIGG